MDREEATSPSIAITPSLEISFFTTVEASPCLDWSSSVSNTSFFPNAPPAAFASSIASKVPLWDMVPKEPFGLPRVAIVGTALWLVVFFLVFKSYVGL